VIAICEILLKTEEYMSIWAMPDNLLNRTVHFQTCGCVCVSYTGVLPLKCSMNVFLGVACHCTAEWKYLVCMMHILARFMSQP